jgi:hypothetical protein
MAIQHNNTTVSTTPISIVSIPVGHRYTAVQVSNTSGAQIFLGDEGITATGATIGNRLPDNQSVQIWLGGGDTLYAVCGSSPAGYISVIYSD